LVIVSQVTGKLKWVQDLHYEGKEVIAHVADILKQQEQHQNLQIWSTL